MNTGPGAGACVEDPPASTLCAPVSPSQFGAIVVRAFGTAVVIAHGPLDKPDRRLLDDVLTALINDPANLTVTVDLSSAILVADNHMAFIIAACRARRRGTRFIVKNPPDDTERALHDNELGDLVEILR